MAREFLARIGGPVLVQRCSNAVLKDEGVDEGNRPVCSGSVDISRSSAEAGIQQMPPPAADGTDRSPASTEANSF